MSRNFFIFSVFYSLNEPLSCHCKITLFRLVIMLRQTSNINTIVHQRNANCRRREDMQSLRCLVSGEISDISTGRYKLYNFFCFLFDVLRRVYRLPGLRVSCTVQVTIICIYCSITTHLPTKTSKIAPCL